MERVIMESTFYKEGELLLYRVRGNAFLPHMIRCMVSLLLGVGMGRFPPSLIEQVLKGERASFNPVAAFGLYLLQVDYGD
jgi:tRNA pseudouridine38-40 synthase